jgi:hypothetical protein
MSYDAVLMVIANGTGRAFGIVGCSPGEPNLGKFHCAGGVNPDWFNRARREVNATMPRELQIRAAIHVTDDSR